MKAISRKICESISYSIINEVNNDYISITIYKEEVEIPKMNPIRSKSKIEDIVFRKTGLRFKL